MKFSLGMVNINFVSFSKDPFVNSVCSFPSSISVARTCNLILIVLDVLKPLVHKKIIENEVEGFGIRLNKQPPNIGFRKKDKGGINLTSTVGDKKLFKKLTLDQNCMNL